MNECPHRWLLETPDGPVTVGRCRLCGGERMFQNVFEGDRDLAAANWTTTSPKTFRAQAAAKRAERSGRAD